MPVRTASLVLGLAVFVAVGVILLGPMSAVVQDNTGTTSVTNETVNADYNDSVSLQGYDVDSGTVTVLAQNSTGVWTTAVTPDDYTLNADAGSLEFNSSSTLIQDGESVKVSYDYQASGPLVALIIGFVPLAVALLIFVGIATKVTVML